MIGYKRSKHNITCKLEDGLCMKSTPLDPLRSLQSSEQRISVFLSKVFIYSTNMTNSYSSFYDNVFYGLKFYWTISSLNRILIQTLTPNAKRRFPNVKFLQLGLLSSYQLRKICVTRAQASTFREGILIKDESVIKVIYFKYSKR